MDEREKKIKEKELLDEKRENELLIAQEKFAQEVISLF